MVKILAAFFVIFGVAGLVMAAGPTLTYPVADTNVTTFYDEKGRIPAPAPGQPFYGQDAHYQINSPSYRDNGDGTISDLVTGLTWQQDMGKKMTLAQALEKAATLTLGGHEDWRVPTIKELYSLILFTGANGNGQAARPYVPYIDTRYFVQPFGDSAKGERVIDAQTWSATRYAGRTMGRDETVFGVNFIDGRIKGYPLNNPRIGQPNRMYFRLVRGNPAYGQNRFADNGDGTISDLATGLMWQRADDGQGRDWPTALEYAQKLELAGHDDWRLPNPKELQTIVDYTRCPQATGTAAIDPVFQTSRIKDPEGKAQYPYFWTSTTHLDGRTPGANAVYIAFGEAQGVMRGQLTDVHGAGAQRSDPKTGDPADYPGAFGPQGDLRYVFNYARSVRSIK